MCPLDDCKTGEDRAIILSALFNDRHIFGYLRNTWESSSYRQPEVLTKKMENKD